jgi:hypothetical protein
MMTDMAKPVEAFLLFSIANTEKSIKEQKNIRLCSVVFHGKEDFGLNLCQETSYSSTPSPLV